MMRKSLSFFALLCSIAIFSDATYGTEDKMPEVLNFYPACDYEIVDTVTYQRRLAPRVSSVSNSDIEKAKNRIISRMKNTAIDKGADAVILIDSDLAIINTSNASPIGSLLDPNPQGKGVIGASHHTLAYTAELIKLCGSISNLSNNATPYNAKGKEQKAISLGTVGGWQKTIELDMASAQGQRTITDIGNYSVDIDDGVFGLELNMSLAEVQKILGTPTFRLKADDEHLILAYGRGLWLVLKHDELASISSKQTWLSSEFINLLAFDERIDDQAWTAQAQYRQNQPISASDNHKNLAAGIIVHQSGDAQLLIDVESFITGNTQNHQLKAIHYALEKTNYKRPSISFKPSNPKLLSYINAYLQQERNTMDVSSLNIVPRASAWLSNRKTLNWYSGNLLIENLGASINKVILLENPSSDSDYGVPWVINGLRQFMTIDEATQQLGDDMFQLNDKIEVTQSHFVQELLFYELNENNKHKSAKGSSPQLISSQIVIYQ
ncbi:hypothetical protein ACFO4O_16470 [Glaciecola siphonariae]|uniref:DUF3352 domain-containing protein n=1 Tax=Glaciecola siphonariae TaxID=521012 RepID=A0ABV9M221_9ALTE